MLNSQKELSEVLKCTVISTVYCHELPFADETNKYKQRLFCDFMSLNF